MEDNNFHFKFKNGNNYNITKNSMLATKSSGGKGWNCLIYGDKEIPKNRVSKWKLKINSNQTSKGSTDFLIGIGPKSFKGTSYDECWSICTNGHNVCLFNKNKT